MKKIKTLFLSVFLLTGTSVFAKPIVSSPSRGWYAGLGLSRTSYIDDNSTAQYNNETVAAEGMSKANIGANAFIGKRISSHLGVQFGFAYPGNSQGKDELTGQTVQTYAEMYSAYVEGVVYLPLMKGFDIFINAGPAIRHFKKTSGGNEGGGGQTVFKYTLFGINYGAGVQYQYRNFGIRAAFNSNYRRMTQRHSNLIGAQYASRDWVDLDFFYLFAPEIKQHNINKNQPLGWYAGAGVNHISVLNEYLKQAPGSPHQEQYLSNSKQFGYEVFFGRRISTYLGGEFGFERIGDYWGKDKNTGENVMTYTDGYDGYIDAFFYIPINNHFTFFMKAGPSIKHAEQNYVLASNGGDVMIHHRYTFFALNYGAGIQYVFKKIGIRFVYSSNYRQGDYTSRDSVGVDFIYRIG
jgi:hypothetical protein